MFIYICNEDGQRGIEDDIEPELERIKDEEDDVNNQGLRVADIPVAQPEAAALVVEPLMGVYSGKGVYSGEYGDLIDLFLLNLSLIMLIVVMLIKKHAHFK